MRLSWGEELAAGPQDCSSARWPKHALHSEVFLLFSSTQTSFFLPWLHLSSTVTPSIWCRLAAFLTARKGNGSFGCPWLPVSPGITSPARGETSSRTRGAQGSLGITLGHRRGIQEAEQELQRASTAGESKAPKPSCLAFKGHEPSFSFFFFPAVAKYQGAH